MNRRVPGPQALELRLVDVEADDLVPRLGEARRGHETDVADADDAEPFLHGVYADARRAGVRLLAIAIMVSGDSWSSSELSTQTTTPPEDLQA